MTGEDRKESRPSSVADETAAYDGSAASGALPFTPPAPAADALGAGRRVTDAIFLEHPLGKGAMGEVWAARHELLATEVAVKFLNRSLLSRSATASLRFRREAQLAARIKSPHVVQVLDYGFMTDLGHPYIVMEMLRGEDLGARIERGPLPLPVLDQIVIQACEALGAAHRSGVVHRDIKPANIFLSESGYEVFLKLVDFGIAKEVHARQTAQMLTAPGSFLGTAFYMSPEQSLSAADVDHRIDLWALAVTIYEAATLRRPFEGDTLVAVMQKIHGGVFAPPRSHRSDLPASLDAWFARALAPAIDERFSTARQFCDAFLVATGSSGTASAVPQRWWSEPTPSERQPEETGGSSSHDRLVELAASLPEPLAAMVASIEMARQHGAEQVRARLLELTVAFSRYAFAIASALHPGLLGPRSRERLAEGTGPRGATDWLQLARVTAEEALQHHDELRSAFAWLAGDEASSLASLADSGGRSVDDLVARVVALVESATSLWLPLCVVVAPGRIEHRRGMFHDAGGYEPLPAELPVETPDGRAFLLIAPNDWLAVDPFLPLEDGAVLLPESPHRIGTPWRSLNPRTGERRDHSELDSAIGRRIGTEDRRFAEVTTSPVLVGRRQIWERLTASVEGATEGSPSVILLSGPPGIGRTRLLDELAGWVEREAHGSRALSMPCAPDGDALRPLLLACADEPHLASLHGAVVSARREDALASVASHQAAVEAVVEALMTASEPLILLVDDLQWADDATIEMLDKIVLRCSVSARSPLCVVTTIESGRGPASSPASRLVATIEAEKGAHAAHLTLDPLAVEEARQLVRNVAAVEAPVERALVEAAQGTPQQIVQPLVGLIETGALTWRQGVWRAGDRELLAESLPDGTEAITRRLASYFSPASGEQHAAEVLLALAALGASQSEALRVVSGLGISVTVAAQVLQTLSRAGILKISGPRHEMVFHLGSTRRAVDRLLSERPWHRRAHGTLLDTIAWSNEARTRSAFLARGYERVGAPDAAAHWYAEAADHAIATGSFSTAMAHADHLGSVVARNDDDRARAVLAGAEAAMRAGDLASARERIESSSMQISDRRLAVRMRILRRRLDYETGQRRAEDDDGLIRFADACSDLRVSVEARLVVAATRRSEAALSLIAEAQQIIARGDASTSGDLTYRAASLEMEIGWELGIEREQIEAAMGRARSAAEALESKWVELDLTNDLAVITSDLGRHDVAVTMIDQVVRRAQSAGFSTLYRTACTNVAALHLRAGNTEDAIRAADRAVDAARGAGSWRHLAPALSLRAQARLAHGDAGGAFEDVDESVRIKVAQSDPTLPIALVRRADAKAQLRRHEEARADAEHALAVSLQTGNVDHQSRARLWLAIEDLRRDPTLREALAEVVSEVERNVDQLRPGTKRLLASARQLISGVPSGSG